MITFSHIQDMRNIGDQVCCPANYFDEFKTYPVKPIQNIEVDDSTDPIVFGGGGIFHGDVIPRLEAFSKDTKRKRIIWGAGHNVHGETNPATSYPEFVKDFDLVGLRDYGNPFGYVPCPSCLHPSFDKLNHTITDIVVLEHFQHSIPLYDFPRMSNCQPKWYMEHVCKFIGSALTVITNSFHGAYWALLMRKDVVIWKPFSSRFYGFKPEVKFADETNWKQVVIHFTWRENGYLEECRALNREFYKKVKEITES